ncbi:hypothetical protein CF326_g9063, partial [Tilletia indica]
MRFQFTTLLAFAAALVAAHPSVEAMADASDLVLRDTNTH